MNRTIVLTATAALVGTFLIVWAFASRGAAPTAGADHAAVRMVSSKDSRRVPVVVELFTSEGCSSCPPADAALIRLKRTQPIDGAEVIALGEHVDYWNRLGWIDPYSSAQFSTRQSDYAQALHLPEVYTPQEVVDGQTEFVGSDESRAEDAIAHAARASKANVTIERVDAPPALQLKVRVDHLPVVRAGDTADVLLAVTEDNLRSNVSRGENAGNTLEHSAVVRQLRRIGSMSSHEPFAGSAKLTLDRGWKRDDLAVVVFVQERTSRRILGAASLLLAGE